MWGGQGFTCLCTAAMRRTTSGSALEGDGANGAEEGEGGAETGLPGGRGEAAATRCPETQGWGQAEEEEKGLWKVTNASWGGC